MTTPRWIELGIPKAFLSTDEVGEILGISSYVTLNLIDNGDLPSLKVGREYRIATADLEEYINTQRGATRD